jgi:lipopolysaccharide export system protein LptA
MIHQLNLSPHPVKPFSRRCATHRLKKIAYHPIFLLCLLNHVSIQPSYSLEADRYAPINIQANHAELSESHGTAIYTGKVELSQGSLRILCDTLTVYTQSGAVNKVEANGQPAHYQQQLENNEPNVQAESLSIVYLPADEKVILKHNAKLMQSKNVFEGDLIEYDLKQQRLSASQSPNNIDKTTPPKRVRMTLQPQTVPSSDERSADTGKIP